MRILISGVSGLIGRALATRLRADGREVIGLSRRPGPGLVEWDPSRGHLDSDAVGHVDAIVHLAGEPLAGRWTAAKRRAISESRVSSTTLLAELAIERRPSVFVSGSAIGFYGDRGSELLAETSDPGSGFLAGVVAAWEEAAAPASQAGVRTVLARTGLVLTPEGGSLQPLLRLFRVGAGGRLGSGEQFWSWISMVDEVEAIRFLLDTDSVEGPTNLVAPNPVTNREFTVALAEALGRPAVLPAPSAALRLVLGSDFADELLLASQRVVPEVLVGEGFEFAHPQVRTALAALLD